MDHGGHDDFAMQQVATPMPVPINYGGHGSGGVQQTTMQTMNSPPQLGAGVNFAGHAIRTEVSDGVGPQFVGQANPNFHPSNFDGGAGGHGHAYQGGMLGHHHQGDRLYTDG